MDAVRSVLDSPVDRAAYEIIVAIDHIDEPLAGALRTLGVVVLPVNSTGGGEMVVAGIRAARGEILAFLDDDDCFLPEKLARVLEVFQDPDLVWYRHGFRRVDVQRRPLRTGGHEPVAPHKYVAPLSREEFGRIRRAGGFYNTTCHTVRADAVRPHADEFVRVIFSLDWAVPLLSSTQGKVLIDLGRVLSEYRTHWSLDSHPFDGDEIPAEHLRKLRGIVREFCWLAEVAPSAGARAFIQRRADSYEALLWTTRRESVQNPRTAFPRAIRAVLGNLEERDLFHAAVLGLLVTMGFLSSRATERVYTAMKRVEMRTHGLEASR